MSQSGCRIENGGDGDRWDSGGGDMEGSLGGDEGGNDNCITATVFCVFRARCSFKVLMLDGSGMMISSLSTLVGLVPKISLMI